MVDEISIRRNRITQTGTDPLQPYVLLFGVTPVNHNYLTHQSLDLPCW